MRLRRIGCGVAVVALAGQVMAAGFALGIDAGYGFGAGRNNWFMDEGLASYTATDTGAGLLKYEEYKDEYVSFGNGVKIGINATAYVNENVGIMLASGFSFLGGTTIVTEETDRATRDVATMTIDINASHVPLMVGMKVRSGGETFIPYVFLAGGIVIPIAVGAEMTFEETGSPDQETEVSMDLTPGFGFSGGLGVMLKFGKLFGIAFECNPTYAFARLRELEIVERVPGDRDYTTTVFFEKNETTLPRDQSTPYSETIYEHGGPMLTFSSVSAKMGIVIGF